MICQCLLLILFVNIVSSLFCTTSWPSNCIYNSTCSYKTKECHSNSLSNIRGGIYCSTLIKIVNDEIIVGNMDCMYDQETTKTCKNHSQCLTKFTRKNNSYLHCCCDQHLCNLNFTISNLSEIDSITNHSRSEMCVSSLCQSSSMILFCSMIGFVLIILIIIVFLYRKTFIRGGNKVCRLFHKRQIAEQFDYGEKEKILPSIENDKQIALKDFQCGNLIKRGRFSTIHEGIYQDMKVAIKILTDHLPGNNEGKKLFLNEKDIYSLPFIEHENILKYYGYSIDCNKYYLICEYSLNGSLRDVLRSRLLKDQKELLIISQQISSGIEHLHLDFRSRTNDQRPPIAHRDLKSENILYINEQKLVICDFAMSIKVDQNQNYPNEQQQIGTPRYMSPEILAGSIGYEPNALLKCDVYALGIVLWEVLSRYPIKGKEMNEVYEMPYENQLRHRGLNINPSINEMFQIINLESPLNRPLINSFWKDNKNENFNLICKTIEECWDQNPEGRISAALVALRMKKLEEIPN